MHILKSGITALAIASLSSTAFAGGLSPEIMEAPVMVEEVAEPASSVSPAIIVLGVLAALLIAAAVAEDDDDDEPPVVTLVEASE